MAKKRTEKAQETHGPADKVKLLERWDGTMAGADRLGVSYSSLRAWRAAAVPALDDAAGAVHKERKSTRTSALDDALELLFRGVHVGRLKALPKEQYGEELKRVRILQRIVGKAVAEGRTPPDAARSLAKHFDALIEGL